MHKCNMKLRDIELPTLFKNSPPSRTKVDDRKLYFKRMGEFPKIIIREDNNRLLDGYASYVAAKELGEKEILATFLTPEESIAYFANSGKCTAGRPSKKSRLQSAKGNRCYICGRKLYEKTDRRYDGTNEFTMDHKIPLTKGGTNTMDNIFPCCNVCNGLKGEFTYSRSLRNIIIAELRTRNIKPELEKRKQD